MAVYCGMFVLHIPYAFTDGDPAPGCCAWTTVRMLWQQKEERFRLPAQITVGLLVVHMGLVLYRAVLAVEVYQHGPDWRDADRGSSMGRTRCWRL